MSLIARYKLNDLDNRTLDSSGNSNTLTAENDTQAPTTVDATYGTVGRFGSMLYYNLANAPSTTTGSSPRTFSFWVNRGIQWNRIISGQGTTSNELRFMFNTSSNSDSEKFVVRRNEIETSVANPVPIGSWAHIVYTYDGTIEKVYINGVLLHTLAIVLNTEGGPLQVGGSPRISGIKYQGLMLDFRIYDYDLSSTEVSDLYTGGPNPIEPLTLTPGVTRIKAEVNGDQVYRLEISQDGSSSTRVTHNGISAGTVAIKSLQPETTYVVTLFSGSEEIDSGSAQTLPNSAVNYDKSNFDGENGAFDLSALDSSELALLSDVINEVFSTGEKLEVKVGRNSTKVAFVKRGETVSTDDSIFVSFNSSSGSGQAFTMQLSDTSTVQVAYDETDNSVSISGQVVEVGGSLVVDGKKCTVQDL